MTKAQKTMKVIDNLFPHHKFEWIESIYSADLYRIILDGSKDDREREWADCISVDQNGKIAKSIDYYIKSIDIIECKKILQAFILKNFQ